MQFNMDENTPIEVTDALNHAGHDAVRVDEQGLSGTRLSGARS